MGNHIYKLLFVIGLFFAGNTLANHCSGGHKEVKDKKETARVMSFTGANLSVDERKAVKLQKFMEFKSLYLESDDFKGRFKIKNL